MLKEFILGDVLNIMNDSESKFSNCYEIKNDKYSIYIFTDEMSRQYNTFGIFRLYIHDKFSALFKKQLKKSKIRVYDTFSFAFRRKFEIFYLNLITKNRILNLNCKINPEQRFLEQIYSVITSNNNSEVKYRKLNQNVLVISFYYNKKKIEGLIPIQVKTQETLFIHMFNKVKPLSWKECNELICKNLNELMKFNIKIQLGYLLFQIGEIYLETKLRHFSFPELVETCVAEQRLHNYLLNVLLEVKEEKSCFSNTIFSDIGNSYCENVNCESEFTEHILSSEHSASQSSLSDTETIDINLNNTLLDDKTLSDTYYEIINKKRKHSDAIQDLFYSA